MNSPFYEAEQRRLYPHRSMADSSSEVAIAIKNLIEKDIDTLDNICNTSFGELNIKYFPMALSASIYRGINIYEITVAEIKKSKSQ